MYCDEIACALARELIAMSHWHVAVEPGKTYAGTPTATVHARVRHNGKAFGFSRTISEAECVAWRDVMAFRNLCAATLREMSKALRREDGE